MWRSSMNDLELGARGKSVFAALCGICCGVPMLVVFGVLSLGTIAISGASLASAAALGMVVYLLARRRSHRMAHFADQ